MDTSLILWGGVAAVVAAVFGFLFRPRRRARREPSARGAPWRPPQRVGDAVDAALRQYRSNGRVSVKCPVCRGPVAATRADREHVQLLCRCGVSGGIFQTRPDVTA